MEAGIHELTAGYALDALDADERRAYEEHLEGCERCREELASLQGVTEALAVAASGPAPSGDLRSRILDAARAEPPAVAAVAAAAAIAFGIWAAQLSNDLDDSRSAQARQAEAVAVLADPDARTIPLAKGTGRLVVAPDGRAALALSAVDPAPAGKTYEAWVIEPNASPVRAGLFLGREGADLVGLERTVGSGDVVAVTVEKVGGVDAPTTQPIVASERV
jgi:anti-sigma-K factor RskA